MALSKKSTFHVRLASLGALAVMIISVIISVFVIVTHDTTVEDPSLLIVGAPKVVEKEEGSGMAAVIFTIVFFLALFIVILILTMREHKRSDVKKT